MPVGRAVALTVLALGMTLSVAGGVAQAKLVPYGSFGSGDLDAPIGVAVDQTSDDLYVANLDLGVIFGENVPLLDVQKFNASESLVTPPSPFGSGSGFYSGVAVNPTNEHVYVLDTLQNTIETYDPSTGVELSSFSISPSNNFFSLGTVVQIAADSHGNVYVPNVSGNDVEEYSPSGTLLQTFTGGGAGTLSGPLGVAVDPAGDVWVADAGNNRIEEFDPAGGVVTSFDSEGVVALAVDASGNMFALVDNGADACGSLPSPCYHLVQYSASGTVLADIGAGSIGSADPPSDGIINTVAVEDTSGKVYVTDNSNDLVWVYGPSTAPSIDSELAVQVTPTGAKLGSRLSPGGLNTSYRFDYGTTTAYGQTTPVPDGDAGPGVQPRTVWASVSGLQPNTTYHYRMVATNSLGTATGPDQTFTTTAGGCPNAQYRTEDSANLPDCRAYELVTPAEKGPVAIPPEVPALASVEDVPGFQASVDGSRISYFSLSPAPDAQGYGGYYVATRGQGGWGSQDQIPPQSGAYGLECTSHVYIAAYSTDLSSGVLADGGQQDAGQLTSPPPPQDAGKGPGCGTDDPNLVAGEPQGMQNLFRRDTATGAAQLVDLLPSGVTPSDAFFDAASSDDSHVVFHELAQLTSDAPGDVDNLYEWTAGTVSLVSYVPPSGASTCGPAGPSCVPAVGVLAGGQAGATGNGGLGALDHAVSADGSRIFFTAGRNLYVRVGESVTRQVDASQAGGSGGGGEFAFASADGSKVYFTDDASAGLTADTDPGSGTNLYQYDTATGKLTDLTPDSSAEIDGPVGESDDGSYVYFVAQGSLAGAATSGQPNLYLWRGGTTTFITTLGMTDSGDWTKLGTAQSRVSANGSYLAFTSFQSLTGYDNTVASGGQCSDGRAQCPEVFLYDASANKLACASCNPDGDRPTAAALITPAQPEGWAAEGGPGLGYYPNNVSNAGQVFFDTADALLPVDTNGKFDVYEYEGGDLHLISSGDSSDDSWFANASPSGNDVFVVTDQQLLAQDVDSAYDLYDARVDGGFPTPAGPPAACSGDACRPGFGAVPPPVAATVTFFGPGNANGATRSEGAAGRAKLLTRTVHGPTFLLRIRVPGNGRIRIAGRGIKSAQRSVARAGTYFLRGVLTATDRRLLAQSHKLTLTLSIRYVPPDAKESTARVRLTVISASHGGARHHGHAQGRG